MRRLMQSSALVIAVALVLMSWARADDRPITNPAQPYAPRLGDIMGATQLRHFKLWYAGKEKNWALAGYELGQIKESFQDAMTFYPTAVTFTGSRGGVSLPLPNES